MMDHLDGCAEMVSSRKRYGNNRDRAVWAGAALLILSMVPLLEGPFHGYFLRNALADETEISEIKTDSEEINEAVEPEEPGAKPKDTKQGGPAREKPFKPSEQIEADQEVDFPYDI